MKRFISSVIRNTVLANVLLMIILLAGAVSSKLMVREVFPEIAVDILGISVVYPGADPSDVEEGISRKIEEAIDGIEGIKKYRTVSSEGHSQTIVEIIEGFSVDDMYTDIRNAVDSISTFPADAEKPIISEFAIESEVMLMSLWGEQSERVLKEFGENIKDELQSLDTVSQVDIFGTRDYEISVELSEERLREYGLTFREVSAAVRRGSLNLSGGQMRTKGEEILLRTVGRKYRGEDFASIVVVARPDGDIVTLGDIAKIKDGFIEDEMLSTLNGHPAITIAISKTSSEDAIAIAEDVRAYAERKRAELPEGLHITLWSDRSEFIQSRLDLLIRNGFIGLAIVFLSLWLFLDLRLSIWVTMGIPISLSGGMLIMWLVGSSLNEMSLFGLIMVLGIVVDDAIIVGESIYVHRKNGDPPLLAATNGVIEVGLPVIAAVTTTIIAFLPLLFVAGVMGRFVKIIPIAVIASLTVSLVESMFLLPAHLNHLPDMQERPHQHLPLGRRMRLRISHGLEWFIENIYASIIDKLLHFRYVTLCAAFVILFFTVGMVRGGFVKFVIFPEFNQRDITAAIEFPRGTPLNVTADAVRRTEEAFLAIKRRLPKKNGIEIVQNVQTVVGQGGQSDRFVPDFGNHVGYVRVEINDSAERDITAMEIVRMWEKETGPIPGALNQTFDTVEEGPPGAPIMVTLMGHDLSILLDVSEELKTHLHTYDGLYQISDSYRPGKNELRIDLKQEARNLGLTLEDLATQVYAGYFGEEALRIQRGRDDIRVRVRYTQDERSTLAQLEHVRIRTPSGFEVPFFSVAEVEFGEGRANITRVDGMLSVSVMAENDPRRTNADDVLADIGAHEMPRLEAKYAGFMWEFDGQQKEARDAFSGLAISFPMALIGMFVIIATVFRSYIQPILIMFTVPFGIVGGVWAHWVMGVDLAMFSIFGMVALTGVVVNDAIVLIEAINRNIADGMPIFEAIRRGGVRRFRAIMLTTLSTVGGLMPLILQGSGGGEVVAGMALSLAGGVMFATVVTLLYLPCLMGILSDLRRVSYWAARRSWPTREEVEPARLRNIDLVAEGIVQPALAK